MQIWQDHVSKNICLRLSVGDFGGKRKEKKMSQFFFNTLKKKKLWHVSELYDSYSRYRKPRCWNNLTTEIIVCV